MPGRQVPSRLSLRSPSAQSGEKLRGRPPTVEEIVAVMRCAGERTAGLVAARLAWTPGDASVCTAGWRSAWTCRSLRCFASSRVRPPDDPGSRQPLGPRCATSPRLQASAGASRRINGDTRTRSRWPREGVPLVLIQRQPRGTTSSRSLSRQQSRPTRRLRLRRRAADRSGNTSPTEPYARRGRSTLPSVPASSLPPSTVVPLPC